MKKTLLLAGAACLFPVLANAQMMSGMESFAAERLEDAVHALEW